MIKRLIMIFTFVSLGMILTACGNENIDEEINEETDSQPAEESADQEVEYNDDEKVSEDKVVANINDVEVTGEMYNPIYRRTKIQLNELGHDISDLEQVKELVIEGIINQEIIKQEAGKIGIAISDDEITSEFEAIKSENEEQFQKFLERYYLTEEIFKEQLFFTLIHDKYVESELPNVQISDEEVEDTYNELKEDNQDLAALEIIKEQLKRELTAQKEQENLEEKLVELKEQATIEKHI